MLAVLAFALEVGAVQLKTSRDPIMGALRFAWWREGLEAIYAQGRIPQQPTLEALAKAVQEHGLLREPLDMLVDSAEMTAGGGAQDIEGLRARCITEGAAPLTLWLRILDAESRATLTAVTAAGTAWSLTRAAFTRGDRDTVLALAEQEMAAARAQAPDVLDAAIPALLPMTLAARNLRLLRRGRDPASDNRVLRQLSLLPRAIFSTY
jgi:phytoene/squalene synthetase